MKRRHRLAIMAVLAIMCGFLVGTPPAYADIVTTVAAGTGQAGFAGDGGPATAAQLSLPNAVFAAPSGSVDVLDANNYRLRRFTVAGNIMTFAGSSQRDCNVVSPDLALNGFCTLNTGITGNNSVAGDLFGNLYVADGNNSVRKVTADGLIYHYAGKYYGSGGYGDGPKYDVRVAPYELHFNNTANELDFSEQSSIRRITAAGNVETFIGAYDNGSIVCTQPVDGSPASGSCLGISGFAIANGSIYLADNGYYTGGMRNPPSVWRVDSAGVMHQLAANLPHLGRLAVAPSGDVYVATSQLVQKVQNGGLTVFTDLSGQLGQYSVIDDISVDNNGNLFAVSSGANRVFEVAQVTTVDPVIVSIVPDAPSATDPLLNRGVTITAANNGAVIDHYEYGWAAVGASEPDTDKPYQTSASSHGLLYYGTTSPNSDKALFARAVATNGHQSAWTSPRVVHTPLQPRLIVLGDSISSGHHKLTGESRTLCKDNNYGYAKSFSQAWLASLPAAWRLPTDPYKNLAYSGFSTQLQSGSVVSGGKDACQNQNITSPLNSAKLLLNGRANSWNRVVISAGVNDTNWGSLTLPTIIAANRAAIARGGITDGECSTLLHGSWNGNSVTVQQNIANGASQIVTGLRSKDATVKITWLDYYNIAGTGNNPGDPYMDIPASCAAAADWAVATVHTAVLTGVPFSVGFVSMDPAMRMDNSRMQPIYLTGVVLEQIKTLFNSKNPPGWPHPNAAGATAIANLIPIA